MRTANADPLEDTLIPGKSIAECAETMIDSYRLMKQIGEGRFGPVLVAEQQHPVRRRVAQKVLKPGMDSREVVAGSRALCAGLLTPHRS